MRKYVISITGNHALIERSLRGIVAAILCLVPFGQPAAQDSLNVFSTISSAEAFALNPVTSIDQDERGILWFGSRNGLLRHDGRQLKRISLGNTSDAYARINDITDIEVSRDGKIWVGTFSGLFRYDPAYGDFTALEDIPVRILQPMPSAVLCLAEVAEGVVWVGTRQGLFVCDLIAGEARRVLVPGQDKELIVNEIYQASNGEVWVGTREGLFRFPKGREEASARFVNEPAADGSLRHNDVLSLLEDESGNLWVGTGAGLDYLEVARATFRRPPETAERALGRAVVRSLAEDGEGRLWAGTFAGIYILSGGGALDIVRHKPELDKSLSDDKIRALFRDNSGSIWVGSYFGGINLWDNRQLNFRHIGEANGSQLGAKVVSSLARDAAGQLLFGTEGGGVTIYDPEKKTFRTHNATGNPNTPLGNVKCLQPDRPDRLWVGTFMEGLVNYDPLTRRGTFYRHDSLANASLAHNSVLSLALQGEEYLWVGMINGALDRLDLRTDQVTHVIRADIPYADTLLRGSIRVMRFTKTGDLYLGTSRAISRVSRESLAAGEFRATWLTPENDPATEFAVSEIVEDRQGRIWVATLGHGLYRVTGNSLARENLPTLSAVYAIVPEADGEELWLSTNKGILFYQPREGKSRLYREEDGLRKNEFSRASGLRDHLGNIYFGGASGVTVFRSDHPQTFRLNLPDVVLTEFSLFDRPLAAGDSTGIFDKTPAYTTSASLAYFQNRFSIGFALPNYVLNNKTVYRYRLLGLNEEWTTSSTPLASYTIQRGGHYRFQVEAVSADGRTTGTTELAIEVRHPPWRTWWAYTLYTAAILATVFLLVKSNARRIRLEHALEMEAREHQRIKETNDQKLRFFTNISHEFRTPLTLILGSLERVLEGFRGGSELYRQLQVINSNASHLARLINELLDFRKLEQKQMLLQAAEGNMVKFVRELHLSFRQQAKDQRITFRLDTPSEEILVYFDRDKFEKVLYNLISNAFRHTPENGAITVALRPGEDRLDIAVSDTGQGISPAEQKKVFDRFYVVPDQPGNQQFSRGSGIGLAIVHNVVELHHGTVSLESEPGAGSTFMVSLPRGRKHLTEDEIIGGFRGSEDIGGYEIPATGGVPGEITVLPAGEESRPLVLVAEDNAEVGRFILDILRPHYRVELVANGRLGYEHAISEQPDLIISDVMMPEVDGIAFCEHVKADLRTSHIPFVLLTARTSLVYKYNGLNSGADDYLGKPFKVKELLLKCRNILQTRERLKSRLSGTDAGLSFGPVQNSLDEELMKKAAVIINENIANESFNVNGFATELGVSRTLLFTKFKAWTGQSPNAYLLELRMKKAARFIEQRKFNIAEVSYQVGYKDPGYFSKAFKKRFGLSPREYGEKFVESGGGLNPPTTD